MLVRRIAAVCLVSLAACTPDKQLNLSATLDSSHTFPQGDNGDDDDDDSAGTSTPTGGGTSNGSATTNPDPTVATMTSPSEATVPATTTQTSTEVGSSSEPLPDTTSTTLPPDTDTSNSDPSNSDPSNSDPSNSDPSSFLDPPDAPLGECDIWAEDCPNGQKCMPFADGGSSWNALKCVPVMGNGKAGQSCTVEDSGVSGLDTCAKHAMCFGVDDNLEGTCVGMCTGSEANPVCPGDLNCTIANDGVLILCLPGCDPLASNCDAGDVCVFNNGAFICAIDASGSDGQQNDACVSLNACDPGLMCIDSGSISSCQQNVVGCCTTFCDTTLSDCPNNLTCTAFFEQGMAPPGQENLGVCTD